GCVGNSLGCARRRIPTLNASRGLVSSLRLVCSAPLPPAECHDGDSPFICSRQWTNARIACCNVIGSEEAVDSCGNSPAPSPARHGGRKKDSNRRAACPLPLRGRGILREYSQTRAAAGISSGEGSEERPSSLSDVTPVRSQIRARSRRDCRGARVAHDDE